MSLDGKKYDVDKPRMDLLPPWALESVAEVLTFGAKKYAPGNWKVVQEAESRYMAAAMRHMTLYLKGERDDKESGIHHLSHAICGLMFVVDLELSKEAKEAEEVVRPFDSLDAQLKHFNSVFARTAKTGDIFGDTGNSPMMNTLPITKQLHDVTSLVDVMRKFGTL